jgi:hypothetical protein
MCKFINPGIDVCEIALNIICDSFYRVETIYVVPIAQTGIVDHDGKDVDWKEVKGEINIICVKL